MSHRWNCPSDLDARRKARSDAGYDYDYGHGREYGRKPYECTEANRAYAREYEREAFLREERAEEERRAARRAEDRRRDEERQRTYWEEEERRRAEEREAYEAELAALEPAPEDVTQPSQPSDGEGEAVSTAKPTEPNPAHPLKEPSDG